MNNFDNFDNFDNHVAVVIGLNTVLGKVVIQIENDAELPVGTRLFLKSESSFTYELNDSVSIISSREQGEVKARSESISSENQYYVEYKAADGRAVTNWWDESSLMLTDSETIPEQDDFFSGNLGADSVTYIEEAKRILNMLKGMS